MKNLFTTLLLCLTLTIGFAQVPQAMKYQTIVRNTVGNPMASTNMNIRATVHDNSATGAIVYQETHAATTNQFGLINLEIGNGTAVSGVFSTIAWGVGTKWMQIEADFGSGYVPMGVSELLSVPYALYSGNGAGPIGATGPIGANGTNGANGLNGTNGLDGLDGASGAAGTNGLDGATGLAGTNGTNGLDGLDGATGAQGTIGATGSAGTNGLDGLDGATGAAGTNGINGANGANGTNGTNGAIGAAGPVGPSGLDGATGPIGANGMNGTNGAVGATGPIGANGTNGTNGAIGATGPIGANGTNGTNGAIGATGPIGANGTNGTNGAVGATGPIGANGTNGTNGVNGLNGVDGLDGTNGTNGAMGANGLDGAVGATGANGTNGLDGAVGATGATGAAGSGAVSGFAYIYNILPQTIAIETAIMFDSNGPMLDVTHALGSDQMVIINAGTYSITFSISATESNQFAVFVNGIPESSAIFGSGAGIQQNTAQVILVLGAGDVITIVNHSSAAAVGLATIVGGTQSNVNASVNILRVQ